MNPLVQELIDISEELELFITEATSLETVSELNALKARAQEVGRAWSGSWIGYHANVYYKDLQPPPPGAYFSSEWGFYNALVGRTTGEWSEHNPNEVTRTILSAASQTIIDEAAKLATKGKELFDGKRDQIISILEIHKLHHRDSFLHDLLQKTRHLQLISAPDFVAGLPKDNWTRDPLVSSIILCTPPHISVLANLAELQSPVDANRELASIADKAASHIRRVEASRVKTRSSANKIYIGHGRSDLWLHLKDFIQERLKLQWDEFNRVPTAGITNISRLSEMLDSAAFAFLVMTAEDEQSDGKMHARMNVVHEAGLFQGRLGFHKGIVLLEEGCEEFTNIQGLVQMRFPKGNIEAKFEEIRKVLEREGLLNN